MSEGVGAARVDHLDRFLILEILTDLESFGGLLGQVALAGRLQEEEISPGRLPEKGINPLASEIFSAPFLSEPTGNGRRSPSPSPVRVARLRTVVFAELGQEAITDGKDKFVTLL